MFIGIFGISALHALPLFAEEAPGAVDDPAPASTAAPAEVTTPPGPATPQVSVLIDDAAEQRYRACLVYVKADEVDDARACFRDVIAATPGTSASLQAAAALFVLDAGRSPAATTAVPRDGSPVGAPVAKDIAPGRLGAGVAGGLLAAFTAINGGIMVAASSNGAIETQNLVLGTGAAAVVLGAAGGLGGYLLGEALRLDEADSKLVGSSLVWGAVLGGHVAILTGESMPQDLQVRTGLAVDAAVLTLVGITWAAGAGSTWAAHALDFNDAQVGLLNSGGLLGVVWSPALLLSVNDASASSGNAISYRWRYLASAAPIAGGLIAGGVLASQFEMTWGEVLFCDLGGVLGLIGGGAAMFASAYGTSGVTYFPAIGSLIGWGGTFVGVQAWRVARGRDSGSAARSPPGGPSLRLAAPALFDRDARAVPGLGVAGAF